MSASGGTWCLWVTEPKPPYHTVSAGRFTSEAAAHRHAELYRKLKTFTNPVVTWVAS